MQCVLLIGLPGSGKSSFFKDVFADSHVRINRDMLKTKSREQRLFDLCLELRQPCVVDNTNVTAAERAQFIGPAKANGFEIAGYFFDVPVRDAIARNAARPTGARIPAVGIYAAAKRLQRPVWEEGFDRLHAVTLSGVGFAILDWPRPGAPAAPEPAI